LTRAIETYYIIAEDIYNFDDEGFLIGQSAVTKGIITREAYKQARIQCSQQDSNREFISLLACISADGTNPSPALIYQGASNDLQNTWFDDLNEQSKAYFTSTAKG
jgi:hypothetical protein